MATSRAWMANHSAAVVDVGGPLGDTKLAFPDEVKDSSNNITGYILVQAESLEAATRTFERHPHFAVFPGSGAEIIEVLQMPGV